MSTNHTELTEDRLRIVFNDTVVTFDLSVDITFGEVAKALDELSARHRDTAVAVDVSLQTVDDLSNGRYGHPIAIDVTLAPPADRARRRVM